MRVHDGHVHIIPDRKLFGRDMTFTWRDFTNHMRKVMRVQLMTAMENDWDSVETNTKFFDSLKNHSLKNRVWAFYWPHANEVEPDFLKRYDVAGIKYHPSVSQLEIHRATAVLDLCEDSGLPLLVHCGRNVMSRIEHCIRAYRERNITIIAAHLGGVSPPLVSRALMILEEELKKNSDLENFYLDTASIDVARLIARAINVIGPRNIIFGTDTPFHEIEVLRHTIQQVWERDDVNITSEDIRNIMYGNLDRIHLK